MNKEKAEALAAQMIGLTDDQVFTLIYGTKASIHWVEVEGRLTPPNSSADSSRNVIHLWEGADGLVYKYHVGKLTSLNGS